MFVLKLSGIQKWDYTISLNENDKIFTQTKDIVDYLNCNFTIIGESIQQTNQTNDQLPDNYSKV